MYHVVKAKFAARNPTAPEHSLLGSFTCLLEIANTEDSEYVWKVISECDLDFNLAAERLLTCPPPPRGSPSFSRPVAAISTKPGGAAAGPNFVERPVVPASFSVNNLLSPPKRQCVEASCSTASSAMKQADASFERASFFSSSAMMLADTPFERASFQGPTAHEESNPEVICRAQVMHRNLLSKVQAGSISDFHELATLEFNLICDAVNSLHSKGGEKGVVFELKKLGALKNVQQLALSGQLWSFVPVSTFEFSGVSLLHPFSEADNLAISRRPTLHHFVKLNSVGLFLKLEYQPVETVEPSIISEIFLPFTCLAPLHDAPVVNATLMFCIISTSEVRTDPKFGSIYRWKGKPISAPVISSFTLSCYDSHEARSLKNVISSLRKGLTPHVLDISRLSQPIPRKLNGLSPKDYFRFTLFSDPWLFARVVFDENLLAEVRASGDYDVHVPDTSTADTKFVLRFNYPPFLMPLLMRAKIRSQGSSWSRERLYVGKLFDRVLNRDLVSRVFPFLNSGLKKENRSPHSFFEFSSLYISSISEDEITVVWYYDSKCGNIPFALSNYLRRALHELSTGKVVSDFDNHLALEGQLIISRRPPAASQITGAVHQSNSANSTSEWMNYLALTDDDVAPESHLPSFFLQSLLPSQRQSLNFMVKIETNPCSKHLFMEFQTNERLSATEITGKCPRPVEHARFFSLCTINGSKFVSSPPTKSGGFLCDPMGSGKTRTCIAMIASTLAVSRDLMSVRSKEACNLILVPPNVLGHWIRELESCFGIRDLEKCGSYIGTSISIAVVHGSGNVHKYDFSRHKYDVVLTTYNTYNSRSCVGRNRLSSSIPQSYYRVFCDEAHVLRSKAGGASALTFDSIWFVTGTPIVLQAEDLNPLFEFFNLKMPKETFRSLLSTNPNLFGLERQKALAILKPIFVYHSPKGVIGGVPVTCNVGSEIVTVRIVAGPREIQVYESFREILHRSRGIQAVLTKIIEGLRRCCSPRSFEPAAFLQLVTSLLNQVEIRLREEPEYVPRMIEAKFVEKNIVQALEYVVTPYAKARIRELWEYLSNSDEKDPHECTVCMEVMKDPLITSCGHWFCGECVTGVLDSQLHMCPICRTRTTNKNLIKLVGWQKVEVASSSQGVEAAAISKPDELESKVQLPGIALSQGEDADMPSKLIYLRRKFLSWVGTDDKIIIFSEFQGCLNSVVELARSVGINAAVLNHSLSLKQRSSRIADFQSPSSSLRLLAVSVATCGVGISLSAATQVIFTEPLISDALEKQCMARVCRWGQSRFCNMERLILSSSVEEMLLKKRDKIKKMINLVSNIRDISDSLPALSGGDPGSVVDDEPDLAIFARDAQEVERPRMRQFSGRRRFRRYDLNAMMFGNPFVPRMQDIMMMGHHYSSSDSEDNLEIDYNSDIDVDDSDM